MQAREIIGNGIVEIRGQIIIVDNESGIPPEEMRVEMQLSKGGIVRFPEHPISKDISCKAFNPKLRIIHPRKDKFGLLIKPNPFDILHNEKIIGLWEVVDKFEKENCAIQFQNGVFLTLENLSHRGIATARLDIFNSQYDIENAYQGCINQLF